MDINSNMDKAKMERLEAAGWKIASAKDFLGLNDGEAALVELLATPKSRNLL